MPVSGAPPGSGCAALGQEPTNGTVSVLSFPTGDVELIIVSSGEHIPEVSPLPKVALSVVSGLLLGPSLLPLEPWWVSSTVSHTVPHPARPIIPPQFGGKDISILKQFP